MLGELINRWPATVPVFLGHKMLCVGCLVNPFHTIADACAEYGLEPHDFVSELNAAIADSGEVNSQRTEKYNKSTNSGFFEGLFAKLHRSLSKHK
ncbi:DUF1858 domain-containing protein [Nioella sp.]